MDPELSVYSRQVVADSAWAQVQGFCDGFDAITRYEAGEDLDLAWGEVGATRVVRNPGQHAKCTG